MRRPTETFKVGASFWKNSSEAVDPLSLWVICDFSSHFDLFDGSPGFRETVSVLQRIIIRLSKFCIATNHSSSKKHLSDLEAVPSHWLEAVAMIWVEFFVHLKFEALDFL